MKSVRMTDGLYRSTFPAIKTLLLKLGFKFNANTITGNIVISNERLIRWMRLVEK